MTECNSLNERNFSEKTLKMLLKQIMKLCYPQCKSMDMEGRLYYTEVWRSHYYC